MVEWIYSPEAWVSLAVLSLMEIVLGIDNIVFITLLAGRLPLEKQLLARRIGLGVALVTRLMLLASISWVVQLKNPLFFLVKEWSGKDLILLGGGIFLLYKSAKEIYENVEHPGELHGPDGVDIQAPAGASFLSIILQIMVLDIVFSLDSVITAVGMSNELGVMAAAVIIAVIVMMVFAGVIGDFVQRNPSVKILALTFLTLIGAMLVMESTGQHVSKGYIYASMGFSLFVQILNLRMDKRVQKQAVATRHLPET
ncbi:MAG: TerC family protein [Deltaproteobacteria bacterium]|nr:TerC family protein [Deltaproteobacteria bacterium]